MCTLRVPPPYPNSTNLKKNKNNTWCVIGAYCMRTVRIPVPAKHPIWVRFENWSTGTLEVYPVYTMLMLKGENT